MGIKRASVWPAGPANLAFALHIPKLIEEGIIDIKGKNLARYYFQFQLVYVIK